jgi:hypothetical protein
MKNFYIAVQFTENNKNYAYVIKVSENDNLLSKLKTPNIKAANIFPTKKRAYEIAKHWNACFKTNGTYYFDEPLF